MLAFNKSDDGGLTNGVQVRLLEEGGMTAERHKVVGRQWRSNAADA